MWTILPVPSPNPNPGPAERFGFIVTWLCQRMADWLPRHHAFIPLIEQIYYRLKRHARRMQALAAKLQAGENVRPSPPRPLPPIRKRPPPKLRPPQKFAWLMVLVPGTAVFGSQLQHLLGEADMKAFLAEAPQAAAMLRPLCRMLGVDPKPLLPPPPPRRRRPAPPAPPEAATPPPPPEPAPPEPMSALPARPPIYRRGDPGLGSLILPPAIMRRLARLR